MAYILTQKDIDDLASKGFDMNGVSEGAEAMPAEMQALGVSVDAPAQQQAQPEPLMPDGQQLSGYSIARGLGLDVDQAQGFQDFLQGGPTPLQSQTVEPRVEPPASSDMSDLTVPETTPTQAQAAPSAAMQSLISSSAYGSAISTDPFENLSKNQRMMLAFAAIKDAGMSLQGKEGTAFQSALGEFRQRADMERKRQIQQAELQARQQVLGSLGAGALAPDASPAEIDAHIAKLTGILATNPQMAPYVTAEVARLQPIRDRAASQAKQITSSMQGVAAIDALINSPDLSAITGFKGTVNEFLAEYGAAPRYSNLMSYIDQLQGLNFLEAYQSLKGGGPITDIEGKQATAARTRINSALKGSPEDLMVALQEARDLFQQALEKNPQYKKSAVPQGLTEDDMQYLNK